MARHIAGAVAALSLILAVCAQAEAEEIRAIPRPEGRSVPYLLAGDGQDSASGVQAMAILFNGGEGYVGLLKKGIPQPGANFLVRSRQLFVERGVPVAVIDVPSDMRGMSDIFRMSQPHADDVAAVADDMQKQFPAARLFLVGTSRGTVSAAYTGQALGPRLAGVVLTSSVFNASRGGAGLSGFDYEKIKAPLLFVHHVDDGCRVTPYYAAKALSEKYPLISVHGGKPPTSGPCDPFAAHGYYGVESATVDAIVRWMLGMPYPTQVE
jgi:pimeloyl-ACP methyl ester carboxylesterase